MTFRRFWCRSLPLALVLSSGVASAQGEDKSKAPPAAKPEEKAGDKGAEDKTAAAKAEYQKAAELFSAGNFMEAVKGFKKAYGLKAAPALLFNIAVCYRKLDEKDLAALYFDKFLKEADAKAPNRAEAEKQLVELKGQGATVAAPEAPSGPAAPPQWKTVDKFEHVPPDETPPGKPLDIRAMVPEKGGPFKLMMYWRAAGQADFTIVEMQRRYFEYVGRIPATAMGGKSVQYYLIVKDPAGKTYAKAGSPTQPNLVLVVEGAKPAFYADLGEGMTGTEPAEPPKPTEPPKPAKGEDTESPLAAKNQPAPTPAPSGPSASGGPTWMTYAKYGTAGASVLCFVVAIAKNSSAASAGEELEKAAKSQMSNGEPRSFFNGALADKEKEGRDGESMATLMTSFGIGFAVAAGTLFYLDYRAGHGGERAEGTPKRTARVIAAPAVGAGFFGFAGQVSF